MLGEKMKQRITLFGMVTVALIFAACDGDSGNNGVETEGDSSSSVEISSSGGQTSSSSAESSSSSSIKYGSFTYGGQTYRTVVIGTQTWMAENLNYADSTAMPNLKGNSWCYENSADSCAKYGRLYTWTGAMNIASSYQSASASAVISSPQQGACPSGWHIPTDDEWSTLETAVGGSDNVGTYLKSTSGWQDDGNGTDAYGFSALPAGNRYGSFSNAGYIAHFWSATEYDAFSAYFRYLFYDNADMSTNNYYEYYAFSVRCVKD